MSKITDLFRQIIERDPQSESARGIVRYLTAPLMADDVALTLDGDLWEAIGEDDSDLGEQLTDALMAGGDNRSLGAVINSDDWVYDPQELSDLDADSVVGVMCLALMLRTDYLLADMRDVDPVPVRESVMDQCRVWLFG